MTRDAIEQFRDAIRAAGLSPPDTIEPGHFHRFPGEGKRNGNTAGWCRLFDDGRGGIFGDFSTGAVESWQAEHPRPFTLAEREAFRRNLEETKARAQAKHRAEYARARERAAVIWQAAPSANDSHPYLIRKGVQPHGLRVYDGALVIPMRDASGDLHSVQSIAPDGEKRFLHGGRVRGCYFSIGKPDGMLCIAEGFATGASIHEATGHAVAVAFNAGNLQSVAVALCAKLPDVRIVLCADDDYRTARNPGKRAAEDAARAVGGLVAIPEFGDDRPGGATDFNDLARHRGVEAIKEAIANAKPPEVSTLRPAAPGATSGDLEGHEWPQPKPIRAALYSVPPFDPVALLPDALRDWVMDEAERMPCAPDFVAAAAVVALGATVGARCAIQPKARDPWSVVPNFWGGIVALPAAKKTPAIGAAMAPVDRLAAKAVQAHQAEMEAFEIDRIVSEAKREAIKDAIKAEAKKPDTGNVEAKADELRRHKADAPQPPRMRRYRTNDATVEKLGELLRDSPAGLLVLRDELVGLLASWDREGREGDRAFFLEAWNGTGSFDTDRIGRGSILIPNLCVSIFGGIQPDKLTVYLEQAAHALGNDGMLQRFQVLVYPDARPWEWRDHVPNRQARNAAFSLFELLADFDPVAWGAIPADEVTRFPHFHFADDAQQVFIEWLHELHRERIPRELADGHPLIAQHLVKYEKLFPALALILHLAECAATGQRGPVTEAAAIRAAAWCEYLEAHARRCYGLLADEGLRAAQALAAHIERGVLADGFTARDVRRNGWRYLSSDAAVRAALDWLEDEGWIRSATPTEPTAGRPTLRYQISPKITKGAGPPTAKTDESLVSAVMAVPHPGVSEDLTRAAHG